MAEPLRRMQRVAAYNICLDRESRLLMCRLSDVTERPGAWTLPGGGIDFGEHPEAGALRELREETGLEGEIVELVAVDSVRRPARDRGETGQTFDYHSIRVIYRTKVVGGRLRHETDESTDRAEWLARDDVGALPLVELGRLGLELAFGGND